LKKIKTITLIFFLNLTFSTQLLAESNRTFSLFYGWGELFNGKSYRAGFGSYELDYNLGQGLGIVKNFYSGNAYISFSPLFILKDSHLGLYGAVGYDFTFFNFLYIKTEFNTATSFSNYGASQAILGLGVYW
jgi:hypothetical protein